jgi:glycosyltransferase involved in cell wall biosynthesis
MKISIVTVCYNSANTILSTLDSVSQQDYSNIEHVIIDGASKDGTLNIINSHLPANKVVVSEPDNGIYDAMNKGIKLASGEIIGTLNADDFYIENDVVSEVANIFEDSTIEACFADLVYVDQTDTDKVVRYWKSQLYTVGLFKQGWMPAHPTFFVRKSVYERLGYFDLNYKIAADFELLFRFIEKNKIKTIYIPKVMVNMRLGGTTNASFTNVITQNKEIVNTLQSHYPNFSLIGFILRKLMNRFSQFINRPN